jgi:hypothetical protein
MKTIKENLIMKSKLKNTTAVATLAMLAISTGNIAKIRAKAIAITLAIALGIGTTTNAYADVTDQSIIAAGTLTEDGTYTLSGQSWTNGGIGINADVTINVTGTNNISVSTDNTTYGATAALYIETGKTLTLNLASGATLTLTSTANAKNSSGIHNNGTITISGSGTVIAEGLFTGNDGSVGSGVLNSGTFTLSGATLSLPTTSTNYGFYNSTAEAKAFIKAGSTVDNGNGGSATAVNGNLNAIIDVDDNTNVDVTTGLHNTNYQSTSGSDTWYWFAPYFTVTTPPATVTQGHTLTLEGTNLTEDYTVPTDNDGYDATNPFGGQTFKNVESLIINGVSIPNPAFATGEDAGTKVSFNIPADFATGTNYKVQVRFQILPTSGDNTYYLTENIGTIEVTAAPTVTVTTTAATLEGNVTLEAGVYTFKLKPIKEFTGGKFTFATSTPTPVAGDVTEGVHTFTVSEVTADLELAATYSAPLLIEKGIGITSVTQPTTENPKTFTATPTKTATNGLWTFGYTKQDETTVKADTANITDNENGSYTITLKDDSEINNLVVTVNYVIPDLDEPTPPVAEEPKDPNTVTEEDAGNAFVAIEGKNDGPDSVYYKEAVTDVPRTTQLLPGTTVTTKATLTQKIEKVTGSELVISFAGPLATVVPSLTVEIPTEGIAQGEIPIVYVFQSTEASVLKAQQAQSLQLRDETNSAQSHAEYKNGILYIYLVGIKEDALGNQSSTAQLNLKEGAAAAVTVATVEGEIKLYDHPLNLTISNTVPSTNFPGSFTLTGEYEIGSLFYRIGAENYKVFTGEILQSEIARLANGELLYLTLNYKDFNNVIVYVPNTFEGTSPSPIPQNRNVTVLLAKDGSIITTGLTSNEEFKFTFTPTVSYDDGTVELTFTRDGLPVQNPPTVEGTTTPIDGTYNITLKNVKTSNLVVTLHYNTTTQIQIVTDNKVWTDKNTLYIQTKNNGTAVVYDVNGKIVKTVATKQGINNIQLNTGVYVVKVGKETFKVVTK